MAISIGGMAADSTDDVIPTEAVAAVIYALTRRGCLTTAEAVEIAGYAYLPNAIRMLNKVTRVPIYQPARGVWALNDEVTELAERVGPVIDKVRRENVSAPGVLMAVPLQRSDLVLLLNALDALLRRGQLAATANGHALE